MSTRSRKLSAFAVFKGKKSSSLTNVGKAAATPELKKSKSASANTTPTDTSKVNLSSLFSKPSSSEKKKSKSDLKKLKKILKSGGKSNSDAKKRPSYLPDSALQSPLVTNMNGTVELKSLRPKGSMANIQYQLPLKATPDVMNTRSNQSQLGEQFQSPVSRRSTTPPLPPRATRNPRAAVEKLPPRQAAKRNTTARSNGPDFSPNHSSRQSTRSNAANQSVNMTQLDGTPPRPPKRRRVSSGNEPSSPQKSRQPSSLQQHAMSPRSSHTHTEPLPCHPADKDSGLPYMFDSQQEAGRLFECLIHPVKPEKFFRELWEKKPLLVKRHMPNYNDGWFSSAELDKILRNDVVKFGVNLDVTTYEHGKRETHNPVGRAYPSAAWDYFQNGCSLRFLNPQTYSRNVWKLLSILQEYFGCCVGANMYLTPAGTQGFAPHYDDIEAFLLQLEGKKHWKLYSPRSENEVLPRFSSPNFSQEEVGEPILDVILEAGDLLYFPRGIIHQGNCLEDAHSMHITVSCYQKNSWGDLLEVLMPQALQTAIEEDVEFRKGLPRNFLQHTGVAFSDNDTEDRRAFMKKVESLMSKLVQYAPIDAACDQLGKKYIHDTLPPVLSEAEKQCSVFGNGEKWSKEKMRVTGAVEIDPDTRIKLVRRGAIRLVSEENQVSVYHNLENARVYHANDVQCIDIPSELAPGVEFLLNAYPEFVVVDNFPLENIQDKIELASALYDKGIVITETPLPPMSESDSECSDCEEIIS